MITPGPLTFAVSWKLLIPLDEITGTDPCFCSFFARVANWG
jgi:hypothetical protein